MKCSRVAFLPTRTPQHADAYRCKRKRCCRGPKHFFRICFKSKHLNVRPPISTRPLMYAAFRRGNTDPRPFGFSAERQKSAPTREVIETERKCLRNRPQENPARTRQTRPSRRPVCLPSVSAPPPSEHHAVGSPRKTGRYQTNPATC